MGILPLSATARRVALATFVAVVGMIATVGGTAAQIRDPLFSASAVTQDLAWAAGAFGTIFHTRDGGETWQPQTSGTGENLFGISFADARVGWAVGRSGTIRHTTDGGASWLPQTSPAGDRHLFHVLALDGATAVAVGDWGTVVATRDQGRTWEARSLDRDVILNGQAWVSAERGWIVGEGGAIFATVDGGRSWFEQPSGVFKTLFGISFADERRGWAVGLDGLILATTDAGESWNVLRGSAGVEDFEEVEFDDAFRNPTLFDIAVRGRFGLAVGDLGAVFASDDGGISWERQDLDGGAGLRWLRAVSLTDTGAGVVVGARGLVLAARSGRIHLPHGAGVSRGKP